MATSQPNLFLASGDAQPINPEPGERRSAVAAPGIESLSPAKATRGRSLVRIALDLALESRERMEAELIAARERIEALELEVQMLKFDADGAAYWEDMARMRAEQLEAQGRGEPIPQIGMTVEGQIGFVKAEGTPDA